MIELSSPADLTVRNIAAVAYDGASLRLTDGALASVRAGRERFRKLINDGVPCYGVTTGLGKLSSQTLDAEAQRDLPKNILRARASGVGPPLRKAVVRAMMMLKLGNIISGHDGVTCELAQYLVDRINDGFTPWVPSMGHGMGADATAHTHCFQTFIGEGFVLSDSGEKVDAGVALAAREARPYEPGAKEGLALLNGIAAAPAVALDALRAAKSLAELMTLISACSVDALAAPLDAIHEQIVHTSAEPGVGRVISDLTSHLQDSTIESVNLQAPISFRVIPQVHGNLVDALANLEQRIEAAARSFSDNPLMVDDAFLSVGSFHNQHLVTAMEAAGIALAHTAVLAERRIHRLLDPRCTGLPPQLAPRPGLDAGLVVVHKAAIDHAAQVRMLASPISVQTSETSGGQEDYMSMALPVADRLNQMIGYARWIAASEMLVAGVALDFRLASPGRAEVPGRAVRRAHEWLRYRVAPLLKDRSPGPDIEAIAAGFDDAGALEQLLGVQ
jgi:histidine ammonia-lyase